MMEVYKKAEPLRIARLNNLLLEILIERSSIAAFSKKPVPSEQKGLRAVKKTILFIRENYNTKISLEQISKYVLLDKYALCKEFKKYTGQTIFENKSFFTKMFKKHIGMTPSEYKKAL